MATRWIINPFWDINRHSLDRGYNITSLASIVLIFLTIGFRTSSHHHEDLVEIMRLQDIFKTPTLARALDLLLTNPTIHYSQGDLARRLNVDKATMRRAIERLQVLGLIDVDVDPAGVRIKAVTFNGDTDAGRALLNFHRRIKEI
jgi:DNA-binding MarR family transcriptional regulator